MPEPIAVIGSSCRFPGGASSPSKLWELLKEPRDLLREFESDRLNLDAFYHTNGEHHGSTDVVNKGYLLEEDSRAFDASFFNINPIEADSMDPQQRLTLESVYECIEAAGYTLGQIQGSMTSVYVGVMTGDYHDIQQRDPATINHYNATGTARSILSNRVSYFFDLHGPSLTLDTACSSSLAALHLAVQSLRNGESAASVVAGVNLIFDASLYVMESKLHMLSPTSRSRMWDAAADGYARGEGVSAVLLKPLFKALEDGDHIECVIRETGMNSDGRTPGITMPSSDAQSKLIRQTYRNAGLDPVADRPQYFECHGTGTLAGDPVEARAVAESFFPSDSSATETLNADKLYCGSIKTVIGHLEGCAGLAGLLKVSLALQNGIIPPNLLFNSLNPAIKPFYGRLQVPTSAMPWPEVVKGPRRASLNSFGFGGTNVHAVVEQYVPEPDADNKKQDSFVGPLVLSAEREISLVSNIEKLADFIRSKPEINLENLAFVTQSRRSAFPVRASFAGHSRDRLLESLDAAAKAAKSGAQVGTKTLASSSTASKTPAILGIFTGQGAQWASMGRHMVESCHQYRKSIELCEEALRDIPDSPTWSLMQELLKSDSRVHEAAISQPLCTATQIAIVDVLKAAGVRFRAVVGHSSGEMAAAYAAGILSASDAMRIAYYRGLHTGLAGGKSSKKGAMMATGLGFEDALAFCEQFGGRIGLAASNSHSSSTLSGDEDAIVEAKEILDRQETFARLLKVDKAYHSHHMLPCAESYLSSLKACKVTVNPPVGDCTWISTVYGHAELIDDEDDLQALDSQYWVDNMTKPVLFSEAVECSLWRAGPFDQAVEIGPHPALKGPVTQTIKTALGSIIPYTGFLSRGDHDLEVFSRGIGYLWTRLGSVVDFSGYRRAFNILKPKVLKGLPPYSWYHEKVHWKEARASRRYRLGNSRPHELLGRRVGDDTDLDMRWRNILKVEELPWTRGHVFQGQILFPTSGYMAMAIQAALEIADGRPVKLIEIRDLEIPRALTLQENHAGVESIFSVRRPETGVSGDRLIEAQFSCSTCSSEGNGTMEKNCGGSMAIEFGDSETEILPSRPLGRSGIAPVDPEAYYNSLLGIGLDYQGVFRGLKSVERTMGYATTKARWSHAELGDQYIMHPGPLDVAFHSVIAAFCSPVSGALHAPYLPIKVERLVLTPYANYIGTSGDVEFEIDSFITKTTSNTFEGDIHIIGPDGRTGLQVEGLALKLFTEARAADDRLMFSKTVWEADRLGAAANLEETKPGAAELALNDAIERTSLYYLKKIFDSLSDSDVLEWKWFHKAFYNASKICLKETAEGKHPVLKKEWLQDTEELIMAYKDMYTEQADIKLIHAVGKALPEVLNSDAQLLQYMIQDNMLVNLYTKGRVMEALNPVMADVLKSISHKFPRANILEVGAGTGGTTNSVLGRLKDAYGQYTYTDVSAGFFEDAKKRFAAHSDKLIYRVLDAERDPLEQGFIEGSQDVIVAANVLHATCNLKKTMANVRKLLKPGGYLVMVEVTGVQLHMMLLMGGLPGWWLGVDEGRTGGPGITLTQWDELLRATGYTGADKYVTDLPDAASHAASVIVSQATDENFAKLQDPLSFLDELPILDHVLIIGGMTLPVSRMVKSIEKLVSRFASEVKIADSIDGLDIAKHVGANTSVISLSDMEKPFFSKPLTDDRLSKLQALFSNATNTLWVTSGRFGQDPYANMTVGLARAFITEMPALNLQILDVRKGSTLFDARYVVETFAKVALPKTAEFRDTPMLWSVEPEIALVDDVVRIPRVVLDAERNDRLNSLRRRVTKQVMPGESVIKVIHDDRGIALEEQAPWLYGLSSTTGADDKAITLQVEFSMTIPFSVEGELAVCVGTLKATGKPALGLTTFHGSEISVHPDLLLELDAVYTPDELGLVANLVAANLLIQSACSQLSVDESLLVYGATPEFASIVNVASETCGHKVIFANSGSSINASSFKIHARASPRTIQYLLPTGVGSVVNLTRGSDLVANHLLTLYGGVTFNIDRLEGLGLAKKHLEDAHKQAQTLSDVSVIPPFLVFAAQDLALSPSISLACPVIVDWTDHSKPLSVTVRPIHGKGLLFPNKTYLMVGLVSDLGLSLCRWMIENGAKYIVITSRSANVSQLWLEEISRLGAVIKVYKMDVSKRDSVNSVLDTIKAALPTVGGVCNGALVLRDQLFTKMDKDALNDVFAPKVDGTIHLNEAFQDKNLDFFVLFSSMSAAIGNAGQSNYNAASLFQAAIANQRRSKGLAASVLSLGMVVDVGYITRLEAGAVDRMADAYYMRISESDAHMIFAEAVAASKPLKSDNGDEEAVEIISGIERFKYNTKTKARPAWFSNPRLSHFVRFQEDGSEEASTDALIGGTSSASIQSQMDVAGTIEEATRVLLTAFAHKIESMLQMTPGSMNAEAPLLDVGIDSLFAVHIRAWFLEKIHVDVPVLQTLSGDSAWGISAKATAKYFAAKDEGNDRKESRVMASGETPVIREVPSVNNTERQLPVATTETDSVSDSSVKGISSFESKGVSTPLSQTTDTDDLAYEKGTPADEATFLQVGKLSYAQSRLWFLDQLSQDKTQYSSLCTYDIKGPVHASRFKRAVAMVIDHHSSLRTCIFTKPGTSEPIQGILAKTPECFTHIRNPVHESLDNEVARLRNKVWDLSRGDQLEIILIPHSPQHHSLLVGYHHIVMDGMGMHIFFRDLNLAYQGKPLPATATQYIDFATIERSTDESELNNKIEFWMKQHSPPADVLPLFAFAKARARPARTLYTNIEIFKDIGAPLTEKIKLASQQLRVTPFHFYLAAMQTLFFRLLGMDDICIGVTDANRNDENAETVGFFLNFLPLRFQMDSGQETFADVVKNTCQVYFAAHAHSGVPLDVILEKTDIPRSTTHTPLFQIAMNHRQGSFSELPLGNCQINFKSGYDAKSPYDFAFSVTPLRTSCIVQIVSRADLYSQADTEMLHSMYTTLLEDVSVNVAKAVSQCRVYESSGVQRALEMGSMQHKDFGWPNTLSERVDNMTVLYPDHIALKDTHGSLTYSQLSQRVRSTAALLLEYKTTPGTRIAVLCEATNDWVIAMLAILRVGATYIPLDISMPRERLSAMIQVSEPTVLLCQLSTLSLSQSLDAGNMTILNLDVKEGEPREFPLQYLEAPDSCSFILFTSGTTGTPKGIQLSQAGIINYLASKAEYLGMGQEVVLQQSSLGFDMAIAQAFNALANGGTLVIAPSEIRGDPVALSSLIVEECVSFTLGCPTEYFMWLRSGSNALLEQSCWRYACSGGEAVTERFRATLRSMSSPPELINCYGPTEISCCATMLRVPLHGDIQDGSVGRPSHNVGICVLDTNGEVLPLGLPGEIYITGVGVAIGYMSVGATGQEAFIKNASFFKGQTRCYRTGDKGVWLEDGSLRYLGRLDNDTTVKLRGLRVDLDDVANTILRESASSISDVVVTVRGTEEDASLVAHVVLSNVNDSLDEPTLLRLVHQMSLPRYMRPSRMIVLAKLPMSPNGKVDRRSIAAMELPPLQDSHQPRSTTFTLKQGELRLLWTSVLRDDVRLTLESDFFMVGGTSLSLVALQDAIRRNMLVDLAVRDMYSHSTLGAMAKLVTDRVNNTPPEPSIVWAKETALPTGLNLTAEGAVADEEMEIVLTGSTGLLGRAILKSLLSSPKVRHIHCLAAGAGPSKDRVVDADRVTFYNGTLNEPRLGLDVEMFAKLERTVDRIILAGSHGHCLNNYYSLRTPNVLSTKIMALLALPRRIPIHFVSSNRVTLLDPNGQAALPPISVADHTPATDGSEGFTATKWASEVFLQRLTEASAASSSLLPITIHRSCAVVGDEAPIEDALNALLRFSYIMRTLPSISSLHVGGYFDFKQVDIVAQEIVDAAVASQQSGLSFQHHSSGVRVPPEEFKSFMEGFYHSEFEEVEVEQWIRGALEHGIEELIVVYLRAITERGARMVFPFMGNTLGNSD
ncbi:putative PKS-NRPS protein [Trichoderma velutinum]